MRPYGRLRAARLFELLFGCILLVGCNHSSSTSAPVGTTTVVIPTPSASSTAATSATAATDPGSPSNANECGIPADWAHVDEGTLPGDEIVVLTWRQKVDTRPLYVDEALVWQRGHDHEGAWWMLASIYRHPKEENKFRLAVICDAPLEASRRYDHAPTAADLDVFLKTTTYSFEDDGFKTTAGRTCSAAWKRAFGTLPPAVFLKK